MGFKPLSRFCSQKGWVLSLVLVSVRRDVGFKIFSFLVVKHVGFKPRSRFLCAGTKVLSLILVLACKTSGF